jgi:putative oxidoreductase
MQAPPMPRRTAGSLMAPIFINGGLDAIRNPESKVKAAEAVIRPLSSVFDFVPDDPVVVVRVNGAIQVAAGTLLALGRAPRLAALVLAGSLAPTTYAGHRFWNEIDDEDRVQQQIHFLKNLAVFGGLLAVAFGRGAGRHTTSVSGTLRRFRRATKEVVTAAA